jgi:hypothetical protein
LFHLSLFASIRFTSQTPPAKSNEPTWISLEPRQVPSNPAGGGGKSKNKIGLSSLGLAASDWKIYGGSSSVKSSGRNNRQLGSSAGSYQYLYQRLDRQLTYPAEFKSASIAGRVAVLARFNQYGQFEKILKLEADSDFLKILVKRLVQSALGTPLPLEIASELRNQELSFFFHFQITEHNSHQIIAEQKGASSGGLFFYRNVQKSQLSWDIGPSQGWGPFVNIDLLYAARKIQAALETKKAKADPLQKYRDDPDF